MPFLFRPAAAMLTIVLKQGPRPSADLRTLLDALDGLVLAGVWGALRSNPSSGPLRSVRQRLESVARDEQGAAAFVFPNGDVFDEPEIEGFTIEPSPLVLGFRDGRSTALRRLLSADRGLYSTTLGFATIDCFERSGRLNLELVVRVDDSELAATLAWGAMQAVSAAEPAKTQEFLRRAIANLRRCDTPEQLDASDNLAVAIAARQAAGPVVDLSSIEGIESRELRFSGEMEDHGSKRRSS